jgi:hypothetical protein
MKELQISVGIQAVKELCWKPQGEKYNLCGRLGNIRTFPELQGRGKA